MNKSLVKLFLCVIAIMLIIGKYSFEPRSSQDARIVTTEDTQLKVKNLKEKVVDMEGVPFKTYYLEIDAISEVREVKVPKSMYEQIKSGDEVPCRLSKDKDGELVRLDILVND